MLQVAEFSSFYSNPKIHLELNVTWVKSCQTNQIHQIYWNSRYV